ncbi:MAG: HlyC/CorC family transporter [Phycisphaerales bacterium]|nr:MAG: HlyC/CorC family transporter [Phycisphaerales bacterium]
MNLLLLLTILVLVLAAGFSALGVSLLTFSRASVERRLAERNRLRAGRWLLDHLSEAIQTVGLLRITSRLAFFILVLIASAGFGENAAFTVGNILLAGVISLLCLWVFTSVLAAALARYADVNLIMISLPIIKPLTLIFLPLTKVLSFIDEIVRRLSGANVRESEAAEEDLLRTIEETQLEGGLDEEAATMLENVVEFSTTDVAEVMTPRTDIEGIELTDDLAAIRAFIVEAGHSRIPVYTDSLDRIIGILYVKDLMPYLGEDASDFRLKPILRQPIIVPETKQVRELLADFQRSEVHMAIVVDEYGGTEGLVTIEDVLEEIVGEIHDEHEPEDEEEPSLRRVDKTHAEADGRYHIDDLNEELGLALPEDEEYDTIGGFVLAQLGRVPETGEAFDAHNARFTTLAATPTHVQRIGIELLTATPAGGSGRGNGAKAAKD